MIYIKKKSDSELLINDVPFFFTWMLWMKIILQEQLKEQTSITYAHTHLSVFVCCGCSSVLLDLLAICIFNVRLHQFNQKGCFIFILSDLNPLLVWLNRFLKTQLSKLTSLSLI
ncbi:unnamed protein product [Mucor hiemalis]